MRSVGIFGPQKLSVEALKFFAVGLSMRNQCQKLASALSMHSREIMQCYVFNVFLQVKPSIYHRKVFNVKLQIPQHLILGVKRSQLRFHYVLSSKLFFCFCFFISFRGSTPIYSTVYVYITILSYPHVCQLLYRLITLAWALWRNLSRFSSSWHPAIGIKGKIIIFWFEKIGRNEKKPLRVMAN
jgi:hypothetical protein